MPVVSQGKLTPVYFAALEKLLKAETDLSWAGLSWSKIKFELDLKKVEAVINWCRHFFTDPTMGVFVPFEMEITVGGKVYPGDKHTNEGASASKPAAPAFEMPASFDEGMRKAAEAVSKASASGGTGDWVGRFNSATGENLGGIHASDTEITFGPKHTFDPKNPAHVRLAKQGGYDPETGKKK